MNEIEQEIDRKKHFEISYHGIPCKDFNVSEERLLTMYDIADDHIIVVVV